MASDAATLQSKVDKLEVNMDRFNQFLNDITGSLDVTIDGGTVPSLLKAINQVLATVPVRGYLTQTALLADLTPGDKTVAFAADTQNQYVKSGAPGVGTWTAAGTSVIAGILSRLTAVETQAAAASTLLSTISTILRLPVAADFVAKTGYTKAHSSGVSYAANVTETEDANGFTAVSGAGLSGQFLWGVRMSYDMTPGDVIVVEGLVVSGSVGTGIGPFIGVDVNTSGDFTAGNMNGVIWRNAGAGAGLYGCSNTGAANSTYDPVPSAASAPAPFTSGDTLRLEGRVMPGRLVNYQGFKNNVKVLDVTQNTAFAAGRVCMGFSILPSMTVRVKATYKRGFSGDTVYASGSVSASGNGTYWAPYKTVREARDAAVAYGLSVCKTYQLSDTVDDALVADGKLFREYVHTGPLAWARMTSAEASPADFALVAGTTDVYTRPMRNYAGIANTFNAGSVYLMGTPKSPASATWYTLPNSYLPATGAAPVDMQAITTGARRVTGGNLYLRLPSSLPSTNPAVANIKVNTSEATLYVLNGARVRASNIIYSYGGVQTVYCGDGVVDLTNCGVEWSESNGIQLAFGALYMRGGWVKYVDNDCVNRGLAATTTSASNTPWEAELTGVELAFTATGDGQSDHANEVNGARSKVTLDHCWIHDVNKDGVVPASCDAYLYDNLIESCGNACVEVICGNDATFPNGLRSKVVIGAGNRLDPKGNGLYGLLLSGFAGGTMDVEMYGTWIGTPAAGGHEIRVGSPTAVSGRTHSQADWRLRYYLNCGTERPAGTRSVSDPGANATLTPVAFNPLT